MVRSSTAVWTRSGRSRATRNGAEAAAEAAAAAVAAAPMGDKETRKENPPGEEEVES